MMQPTWGWSGSLSSFLAVGYEQWLSDLNRRHISLYQVRASVSQISAWRHCYDILGRAAESLVDQCPDAAEWTVVFEYELPRERGRRPDVIILARSAILVLEFKDANKAIPAHRDQVAAYARDIRNYHAASHNREVIPLLVLTTARVTKVLNENVLILSPEFVSTEIAQLVDASTGATLDAEAWLTADYEPLPSLVSAARRIFNHEPLPRIRQAQSAGIPETIQVLMNAARDAQRNRELHLALVTGVPGAGKTLVGLQFVYQNHFESIDTERTAVFLSGNGPLVQVLQHALKSGVFVQDVHGFLLQYGGKRERLPQEHIWVYDEAQRAWDAAQVQKKRGYQVSEPMEFLQLGERMASWALLIGLIGDGQEIHIGEEAGIQQWNDAIGAMRRPWTVHCPPRLARAFSAASLVKTDNYLDLTTTLRSHLASDVHLWVKQLLDGEINSALHSAQHLKAQGFDIYVTRDLERAKLYVQERYGSMPDSRYGLLASSKATNLAAYGVRNEYTFTRNVRVGPWYNDPPDSVSSCCQLREVVTEFASQGLEVDFPIVCWGDDLLYKSNMWRSRPVRRSQARNPHQLRLNSYRVLLTRGRDGFVVFVPDTSEMDSTYDALVRAGIEPF